ncbi:MAG: phospholipid carrier-dependent glycosyltransferase [Clostridia bacterium]|nr:phospholipid carrier-dependent glycosyltransferase [Clostridia bacterium]
MAKKVYDDDDGRTIVDMSGVERPRMFGTFFRPSPMREERKTAETKKEASEGEFSNKERRWYIFGAMGAALAIGAVFAIGFALAIVLMLTIWHAW